MSKTRVSLFSIVGISLVASSNMLVLGRAFFRPPTVDPGACRPKSALQTAHEGGAGERESGVDCCYTIRLPHPRSVTPISLTVRVDGASNANFISGQLVSRLGLISRLDRHHHDKTASHHGTRRYVRFRLHLVGAERVMTAVVVPGETNFSLLLGRPWLQAVQCVEEDGESETSEDVHHTERELRQMFSSSSSTSSSEMLLPLQSENGLSRIRLEASLRATVTALMEESASNEEAQASPDTMSITPGKERLPQESRDQMFTSGRTTEALGINLKGIRRRWWQ